MKVERRIGAVVMVMGVVLGGAVVASPDAVPAPKVEPSRGAATPAAAPALTQDQMMANWQKASTPGPEHKVLENYSGHWAAHVKAQMDPSQPPQESDGTADGQLVLGGRFVHVMHKGTMMGQPFEGMMLLGYDNIARKYVAMWVDNAGTAIVRYDGSYDKKSKRLMMGAQYVDPMTLKPVHARSVTTFVSPTSWRYEEFVPGPDGKERLALTITFTKA